MNLAVGQSISADIYIENDYEQTLDLKYSEPIESLDWIGWFQNWLIYLSNITDTPQRCELSLRLTGDRQMQEYNLQYRQMNKSTDVLAFAAMEADINLSAELDEPIYLGDIIISLDTAICQAIEQKHSLTVELAWLSSHGLLHLLGWDHPDDESLRQMLSLQSELIQSLNPADNN